MDPVPDPDPTQDPTPFFIDFKEMEGISENERNFQLFKAGLSMVSCLTGEAIRVLEANLKGLQGLFFGLGQWGVIMSICIEYHEKSLVKHKELICERGAKIDDISSKSTVIRFV